MKEVKVVSYKEVGFNYNVCDEIYENGCGKDIEGRFLEVGFWKEVFESTLEFEDNPLIIKHINEMVEEISKLDDEVLVEF
jgi:hypothetical protein